VAPWTFTSSGRQIEVLATADWVEEIRQDKGRAELTGVDQEGRYEAAFCDMFVSKLSATSVLLDIGAGYGLYSVIAAHVCPPKNIHSFEPDRLCRWFLGLNNKKYCNGQLNIESRFVSSKTNRESVTVDDYCAQHTVRPTVIKMDIEGGRSKQSRACDGYAWNIARSSSWSSICASCVRFGKPTPRGRANAGVLRLSPTF